jgi:hypothetical protein
MTGEGFQFRVLPFLRNRCVYKYQQFFEEEKKMTKTHLIRITAAAVNLSARICFLGVLAAILPTLPAKGTTLTADQICPSNS